MKNKYDGVEEAINRVVAQFPDLTDFGFGVWNEHRLSREERIAKFAEDRARMFHPRSLEQFVRACAWLQPLERTQHVNPRAGSSYGMKHVAEHDIGYITNGMFIAAAVACGLQIKRIEDSPNAWFNLRSHQIHNKKQ